MNVNSSPAQAGANVYMASNGRWVCSVLVDRLKSDVGTGLVTWTHLKFDHVAAYMEQTIEDKVVS
jgi:hypothetical protein